MRLPSYASACDFDLLRIEQLAALTPNLLGREPTEELVGIGLRAGTGAGLASWPLTDLNGARGPERFCAVFEHQHVDRVRLVAFASAGEAIETAIAPIRRRLDDQGRYQEGNAIAVHPDGHWTGLGPNSGSSDQPVPATDPVAARLWTLAFRAGVHRARLAADLAGAAMATAGARARMMRLRESLTPSERQPHDRRLLEAVLNGTGSLSPDRAVALGLALTDDTELLAAAIDAAWDATDATDGHLEVWEAAARAAVGRAGAVTAVLAALAAWRTDEKDLALAWWDAAVTADADCPFVHWVGDLLHTGIDAASLRSSGPLQPNALNETRPQTGR